MFSVFGINPDEPSIATISFYATMYMISVFCHLNLFFFHRSLLTFFELSRFTRKLYNFQENVIKHLKGDIQSSTDLISLYIPITFPYRSSCFNALKNVQKRKSVFTRKKFFCIFNKKNSWK